jgi:hypothetical protein
MRKKRKMKLIGVEMQNVEFFRELADPVEHQHVIRGCVARTLLSRRNAMDAHLTSLAAVTESALANKVTS